jgi:hypothetical protein
MAAMKAQIASFTEQQCTATIAFVDAQRRTIEETSGVVSAAAKQSEAIIEENKAQVVEFTQVRAA